VRALRVLRSPLAVDSALAVALAAVGIFQGFDDRQHDWKPYDVTAAVLTALATLPVAVRRLAPVPVLLLYYLFWLAEIALGYNPVINTYGMLLAMYTVAATQVWWWTAITFTVGAVIWVEAGLARPAASPAALVLQAVAVPLAIWKIADTAKQLDRSNHLLVEANDRLRDEQEDRARRAVTDERVRVARELHDVVAHHMAVVSVQAGLARYVLRSDPDTAGAAIDTVLGTSTEALDEMRRMLVLLRIGTDGEPAAYDPAPGLPGLPELVDRVRAAGVAVELRITGAEQPLPPGAQLCAYRMVQESLTNVLKHAPGASATVDLRYGPGELTVAVADDGPGVAESAPGSGHGLVGMRERAELYGGTLAAGPRGAGGFEVRLVLPLPDGEDR
jgi:signal transduction histidine kinase